MSDADLRELERRWRETGCVEDEAAWLRARVQAGDLSEEHLELIAALRSDQGLLPAPPWVEPWSWVEALSGLTGEARSRFGLALALASLWLSDSHDYDVEAERAAWACEEWIVCPSQDHLVEIGRLLDPLPWDAIEKGRTRALPAKAVAVAYYLFACPNGIESCDEDWPFAFDSWKDLSAAVKSAGRESEVRQVVSEEFVPWVLGYSDPVRERVEARQREGAGG